MTVVGVLALLAFDTIVCIVEIPKMRRQKLFRELAVFSVLLILGTVTSLLTLMHIKVPNPSDFLKWVYSPVSDMMKSLTH